MSLIAGETVVDFHQSAHNIRSTEKDHLNHTIRQFVENV